MASFNLTVLVGNLTRDPELRGNTGNICSFGLAVNNKFKQGEEMREEVLFIDVSCFKNTAANVHQYLKKGSPVLVKGRLKLDKWTDRSTGQNMSKIKVDAEQVVFLPNPNAQQQSGGGQQTQAWPGQGQQAPPPAAPPPAYAPQQAPPAAPPPAAPPAQGGYQPPAAPPAQPPAAPPQAPPAQPPMQQPGAQPNAAAVDDSDIPF